MKAAQQNICIRLILHARSQVKDLGGVRNIVLTPGVEHALNATGICSHLDDPAAVSNCLIHGAKGQEDLLPGITVGIVFCVVEAVDASFLNQFFF